MTITPVLDARYLAKDGFAIKIRVIDGDDQKTIPVGYRVYERQWSGSEVVKHKDAAIINEAILDKINEVRQYFTDCRKRNKKPSIKVMGHVFASKSFVDYLIHRAKQYKQKHQLVMDRKVRRFAKELKECFGGDVQFDDLNADNLRNLEAYLIKKENCQNTRHKKFKFLRQFYGNAMDEGQAVGPNPFKSYKIKKEPTNKTKLTPLEIEAIEKIDLQEGVLNDARNLFLFSYYTKGSRFATCLTFRKEHQVQNGRVVIKMNKGKKIVSVKIHARLKAILDYYNGDPLTFPFLKDMPETPEELLRAVDSQNVIVNRNLKFLAAYCGIKKNLTFHLARHSFAQQLKTKKVDIYTIQESMGHSDIRTTQQYLESLGDETIDAEMEKIYGE